MSRLIGLDWGTSQLRAMLFDAGGNVSETRQRPWGIRSLPDGGFASALADVCAGWPAGPILAAGMVGSRQGWHEVDYVDAPAGLDRIAASVATFDLADGRRLTIVPGVRDGAGPDLMRGEETQVVGAFTLQSALAVDAHVLLPGTHSKWVDVRDGHIVRVTTAMTGELYALLRDHSILGAGVPSGAPRQADAFDAGVRATRAAGAAGAASRLFSARALVLEGSLDAAAVPDYLSGLLIGDELRIALAAGWFVRDRSLTLVGDAALCARYRRAALLFELAEPAFIGDAAAHGLWRIAVAAALVDETLGGGAH